MSDDNVIHLRPKEKEPDQKTLAVLFSDIADFAERVMQGPTVQAQPSPERSPYKSVPFKEVRKSLAESLGFEGAARLNAGMHEVANEMKSEQSLPPAKLHSLTMLMLGQTTMLLDMLARYKTDENLSATAKSVFGRVSPDAPDLDLEQKAALLSHIRAARLAALLSNPSTP